MNKELFAANTFKYLHLLSLYLNKKKANDLKIEDKDLSFFIDLSKYHSLTALLYKALKETEVDVNQEQLKKLEEKYFGNVRKSALFAKERKELFKYLNDNQIDYLPLKGIIIREYWLDPDTREFADNDILFLNEKTTKIKEFFVDKGYSVEYYKKSNHDVYLKKPFYNFEMHRALFGKDIHEELFVEYFKDTLKTAPIKEGYEHYLSKEDFYIYFTAHTYKHFQNSGCGLRTLVDYYCYLKNNNLDFIYVNEELNKIELLDFSNKIISLTNKIFNEQELTDEEKDMLLFISSSGTYGTLENSVSKGVKEKGKFKYLMSRVFPPLSFYRAAYPWAYKTKVLIPVAWFMRFFRILFKNPRKATKELKMISQSKETKNK